MDKKAERIIENIFDVMMQTDFAETAQKELNKDLEEHNVTSDKTKGLITIEDEDGEEVFYSIKIEKLY